MIEDIVKRLDKETTSHIRLGTHALNRASEGGWVDECLRFLVLARLRPEDRFPVDISLQRIFDEGHKQEKLMRMELEEAGFTIIQTQRDLLWAKFQLSGHIDGLIEVTKTTVKKRKKVKVKIEAPLEIKSCNSNIFKTISKITHVKQLLESSRIWLRGYPAQIMLYMLLMNKDLGIILFKDKSTGQKHQINVDLDYEYTERILKGLEKVNDYVARKKLPAAKRCDACERCGFARSACFVGKDFGAGYVFLNDTEAEKMLIRREKLYLSAKEYTDLDKKIKVAYRGKNILLGDFKILSNKYDSTTYKIPDKVKDKYAEKSERIRVEIEKL